MSCKIPPLSGLFTVFALLTAGSGAAGETDATHAAYWGKPSVDGGKCCASLAEVREHIDALDGEIVALLAERQKYVAEAGRFKKDSAAVSAPGRVEAVVARVRTTAEAKGLAPDVAERTWRAMIAAFEDYERAQWRGTVRSPSEKQ